MSLVSSPLTQFKNFLTPVQDKLPEHIEKLIGKSAPITSKNNIETPKARSYQNSCAKYKIRPRVLYEEVNKVSKIIENKKLADLLPQCKWVGREAIIKQPVSLKNRRQLYMQTRLSEKRKQRKQLELSRRVKSQDEIICHFRDIISDQIKNNAEII